MTFKKEVFFLWFSSTRYLLRKGIWKNSSYVQLLANKMYRVCIDMIYVVEELASIMTHNNIIVTSLFVFSEYY
jgi:hypothetical protein